MVQRQSLKGSVEATVAAMLCAVMAVPPAMLADGPKASIPVETHAGALTQQQRVLHALNRFTFGPRPGDEAAVAKMGLDKWFDRELHPDTIDDAALETRLDMFPAMRLSQAELMLRFPSPQMLKAGECRDISVSNDPVQRAILADAEAAYEVQKKKQAQTSVDTAHDDKAVMDGAPGQPVDSAKKGLKHKVDGLDAPEVDAVLALPPEQRFGRLVAMSPEEMLAFRAGLEPRDRVRLNVGLTPAQMEAVAAMTTQPTRVVGAEALESRLVRDVYSERQLQAVMTDFWLNHFNVYVRKNQNEPYLLPEYQRETILPNALGSFETLLVATAKSPAMLTYLDNWQSIGPDSIAATRVRRVQQMNPNGKIANALPKGINENYARELMELHTLGVGGGYTQADVIAVAKCFTGWTVNRKYGGNGGQASGDGEFVFEPNRHEGGDKVVLGHTIHEGGMNEGLQVLHILATNPATAHFIANKLAVRFVSDTPSPALVNTMAATFLKTNGDIAAVLSTMFHSAEFWSPEVYRAKVKTPLEFMVSALRASDAQVNNPLALVQAMDRLGMPIFGMQTPNGYSWMASEWVNSNALIARMNFALVLSGDRVAGTRTNWPGLLGGDAVSVSDPSAATERRLESLLLGQPAAERTRATVMAQFKDPTAQQTAEKNFVAQSKVSDEEEMQPGFGKVGLKRANMGREPQAGQPETPLDTMAGLLLGSPEFQRR